MSENEIFLINDVTLGKRSVRKKPLTENYFERGELAYVPVMDNYTGSKKTVSGAVTVMKRAMT